MVPPGVEGGEAPFEIPLDETPSSLWIEGGGGWGVVGVDLSAAYAVTASFAAVSHFARAGTIFFGFPFRILILSS